MPDSKNTSDRLTAGESAAVRCEQADPATLRLHVSGRWKIDGATHPPTRRCRRRNICRAGLLVALDAGRRVGQHTVSFLLRLKTHCSQKGLTFDPQGLPAGIQGLLKLATAVPAREGARRTEEKAPFSPPRRWRAACKERSRRGFILHRRGISGALQIFRRQSPIPKARPAGVHSGLRPPRPCRSSRSSACWWA